VNRHEFINYISKKRRAYNACFHENGYDAKLTDHARIVLADLVEFCQPYASTHIAAKDGNIDPIAAAVREGQRSVYNHIIKRLRIDDLQVIDMIQQEEGVIDHE